MKKKSIVTIQKEREEKQEKKKKGYKARRYRLETITDSDYKEVVKEYPYIKKDINGMYFIDRSGKRQDIIFPYIPLPDDDSTIRILFKKAPGEKEKPFIYAMIDNDKRIMEILENKENKVAISWRIAPNKLLKNIKKGTKFKGYVLAQNTVFFPEDKKEYIGQEASLHRFVMSIFDEKDMKKYIKENKKEARSVHIDHFNNNELDCRFRNLSIVTNEQNTRNKKEIDKMNLLDNFCVIHAKDGKTKYIMFLLLGNKNKMDLKRPGTNEKIEIDNTEKDGEGNSIYRYNFINYNEGMANIVCALFSDFDSIVRWYHSIFTEQRETALNIDERNEKIRGFFQKYADGDKKELEKEGLEKVVLLANTNEKDGKIEFDDITDKKQASFIAEKRGLVVERIKDEKTGRKKSILKNIQNLSFDNDSIVDILYPYIENIFDI